MPFDAPLAKNCIAARRPKMRFPEGKTALAALIDGLLAWIETAGEQSQGGSVTGRGELQRRLPRFHGLRVSPVSGPRGEIEHELAQGKIEIAKIVEPTLHRTLFVAWSNERPNTPQMRAVLEIAIRETANIIEAGSGEPDSSAASNCSCGSGSRVWLTSRIYKKVKFITTEVLGRFTGRHQSGWRSQK